MYFELQIEQSSSILKDDCCDIHTWLLFKISHGPEHERPATIMMNDVSPSSNGTIETMSPASQSNVNEHSMQVFGKDKLIKKSCGKF